MILAIKEGDSVMSLDFLPSTKGKHYTGACHCGAVKIEMAGPIYPFVVCHCRDCLRTSGFTWAAAKLTDAQLTFTSGEANVDWYHSSDFGKRGCCKTCHSHMFFKVKGSDLISVAPGIFDNFEGLETVGHIYRDSLPDACQALDEHPDIDGMFYAKKEV